MPERLSHEDIRQTEKIYNHFLNAGFPDGWSDQAKEYHFDSLTEGLGKYTGSSLKGCSFLDVGCGTGDFFPFSKKLKATYVGVDISFNPLKYAKKKYPEGNFVRADILQGGIQHMFDFSIASGTFTIKQSRDNYEFMESMLQVMWGITDKGLAFNVVSDETEDAQNAFPFVQLYDIEKLRDLCRNSIPDANLFIENTVFTTEACSETHATFFLIR